MTEKDITKLSNLDAALTDLHNLIDDIVQLEGYTNALSLITVDKYAGLVLLQIDLFDRINKLQTNG